MKSLHWLCMRSSKDARLGRFAVSPSAQKQVQNRYVGSYWGGMMATFGRFWPLLAHVLGARGDFQSEIGPFSAGQPQEGTF
jgi:hypothetical protein